MTKKPLKEAIPAKNFLHVLFVIDGCSYPNRRGQAMPSRTKWQISISTK